MKKIKNAFLVNAILLMIMLISSSFAVENNSNLNLEDRVIANSELDINSHQYQNSISIEDARLIALMNYRGEIVNENIITNYKTGNLLYLFTIKENSLSKLIMVDETGNYDLVETMRQ